MELDNVASACYVWQHGGADVLASNLNVATVPATALKDRATALLHQGCPVAVRDCQVVIGTGGITVLNSECSKLYGEDQPLLHLDRLGLLKVVRIVARIVW